MQCISCGKGISINAKICPYCHRDTTASVEVMGGSFVLGFIGMGVGYLINDFMGSLIGAVLLGGIGGAILFFKAQAKFGNQPSTVQIASETHGSLNTIEPTQSSGKSSADRLEELMNLKKSGFLTDDEYNLKRSQILNEL